VRHRVATKKLRRESGPRAALLRSLARSLVLSGHIETTLAKAKAVRPFAEKLITLGKRKDRNARRLLSARIRDEAVVNLLLTELADRYQSREGGYTRLLKVGFRQGDGSPMGLLTLVDQDKKVAKAAAKSSAKVTAKA